MTGAITYVGIAQLVEFLPSKQTVAGSSPVSHSIIAGLAQLVRALALQARGLRFESVNPHHFGEYSRNI